MARFDANRVIGLTFAGADGLALANPIAAVVRALSIDLTVGVTMHGFLASTATALA